MDDHGLEFENIVSGNYHGMFRHYAERTEGDDCQVYEYRNLEHEGIHIDVWDYQKDGLEITFETHPDKVSVKEKYFDAT